MNILGYIKNGNTEQIRFEGDIRIEHPEITEDQTGDLFPSIDGYEPVYEIPIPEYNQTQTFEISTITKIDGKWVRQYTIRNMTDDEIKARNALLESLTQTPETRKPGSKPNAV
jgi:hypothetical protein